MKLRILALLGLMLCALSAPAYAGSLNGIEQVFIGDPLNGSAGVDPCLGSEKLTADFESTSSGGSIITGVAGKKIYLCAISLGNSTAANVSLIEGTGSSVCTSGTPAGVYLNPGVTAANGYSFGATSGIQTGDGSAMVAKTATAGQNLCALFSVGNSPQVNVHVAYVVR